MYVADQVGFVFVLLSCLFIAALWSPADLLALLYVMFYCGFYHFPMWCSGSGVVLV